MINIECKSRQTHDLRCQSHALRLLQVQALTVRAKLKLKGLCRDQAECVGSRSAASGAIEKPPSRPARTRRRSRPR